MAARSACAPARIPAEKSGGPNCSMQRAALTAPIAPHSAGDLPRHQPQSTAAVELLPAPVGSATAPQGAQGIRTALPPAITAAPRPPRRR